MCYKQAGLMQDLRARLIYGGFPQVEFRILNTEAKTSETNEGLWRLRYAAGHPIIPVLQETPTNILWHDLLDGALDHILVLDRCRRLTYQVITPWSILHFPYVKAAILSTYEDDPCGGPCTESLEQNITDDFSMTSTNSTLDVNEVASIAANSSGETLEVSSSVESPAPSLEQTTDIAENLVIDEPYEMNNATLAPLTQRTDGTVPIRVVMHVPHMHRHVNGTVTQHEYLELQTGNPDYHGHLANDNNIVVEQTHKRKKYKGHKRKEKLKSEAIQTETQESNNYEDTKLKHHRDKQKPQKKTQNTKSGVQNATEEASAAAVATTATTTATTATTTATTATITSATITSATITAATTTEATIPLFQDDTTLEAVEVNTEVYTQEIPQEIQEHYDYRNMPYYKHLHKPAVRVTEAATVALQEETVSPGNNNNITSDKDHRKWESHTTPEENEKVMVNTSNRLLTETPSSDQHNTNTLDLNSIDSTEEQHNKYTVEKEEMENQATTNNGLDSEDEDENKKQVIQHYSQLLKWIHYNLPD